MGDLLAFPTHRIQEQARSKRQLASHLGRSTRWVELRMREGAPYHRDENGHARFYPSEFEAWLEQRRAS